MELLNPDIEEFGGNDSLMNSFNPFHAEITHLANQSIKMLWELNILRDVYMEEADHLIEKNEQFLMRIRSLSEKMDEINRYSKTIKDLVRFSLGNAKEFVQKTNGLSKLYDIESSGSTLFYQNYGLLEDLLPFLDKRNVSLMDLQVKTPQNSVLVSDDEEDFRDSWTGSGYEWEHGARVRNCTQLHWSLDAAVPRVRRQELIPRAKLRPDHQNIWRTMSSSSDTARRLSQHILPDQTLKGKQPEERRSSKYDIYGTANKPFGESYRKSLIAQEQDSGNAKDREDSSVETDSVEESMGCNTSRTQVALNEETVKGNFTDNNSAQKNKPDGPISDDGCNNNSKNEIEDGKKGKLSDLEIIYGSEYKYDNNDSGYSTSDIYSEVKKSDNKQKNVNNVNESTNKTPREQLMQQIRERNDTRNTEENHYSTIARLQRFEEELEKQKMENKKFHNNLEAVFDGKTDSAPVSFVEEEYSYEPEKKEAISKIVVRSRSLLNLDQKQMNYNTMLNCNLKRPNELKLTTNGNGYARYGLIDGNEVVSKEVNAEDVRHPDGEIKANYVSSIKNAFDAAIEKNVQNKSGKAEAFDGLRQYFQDNKHGLQELLTNNNVVIIEPFKHDPPRSPSERSDASSQRTCRITGATIKSPVNEQSKVISASNTIPRRSAKFCTNNRQGFYHPIKVNKELIDAELPDPDKVKSARELFESVLKSKSSTETPPKKQPFKSFFNTIASKMRITPEVKVIQEGRQSTNDAKKQRKFLFDNLVKEDNKKYPLQRRWTDSGSLSSGVSSDFSCDQDCDFHHHDSSQSGSNQEILEEYSSDEDDLDYAYPYDVDESHPVSSEVMQKIRACGTTVTYYGGKVISRSHGQCRSPMTMTIMDEIRQNGGTSEGRKKFESEPQEPYLGVKFKLVKSHSCGSRLEIAGAEEDRSSKNLKTNKDNLREETIAEEVTEVKEEPKTNIEPEEDSPAISLEEEEDKVEADRYGITNVEHLSKGAQRMTWAELKLKEARKQWHCTPEAVRIPSQDMEFETFEVLDDSKPLKAEASETGRG